MGILGVRGRKEETWDARREIFHLPAILPTATRLSSPFVTTPPPPPPPGGTTARGTTAYATRTLRTLVYVPSVYLGVYCLHTGCCRISPVLATAPVTVTATPIISPFTRYGWAVCYGIPLLRPLPLVLGRLHLVRGLVYTGQTSRC